MTCNDSSTTQGDAVTRLDDADPTRRYDDRFGQCDRKKQCVDSVGARWNQAHLRASLTSVLEERACVLKSIAGHQLSNDSAAWQRFSVACLDATDFPRRHQAKLDQFDLVLPRPHSDVKPGSERVCLIPGFAVQGIDPARRREPIFAHDPKFLCLLT